jgi:hypothetical protein
MIFIGTKKFMITAGRELDAGRERAISRGRPAG